jgi:hypothetical protein
MEHGTVSEVRSGSRFSSARAQAGCVFASGHRRKTVPSAAALAPRVNAAATPRPSPIPPAAMIGRSMRSAIRGSSANRPTPLPFRRCLIERSPMPTGLIPLRDDRVRAGLAGDLRLRHGRGGGEPRNTSILQTGHERGREDAHDRRDGRGGQLQERVALRLEVRQDRLAGCRGHRWTPLPQERPHPCFSGRVSSRQRVWNPHIELNRAAAVRPELLDPRADARRGRDQRAHRAHPAGVRHRDRQTDRTRTGHRGEDDGNLEAVAGTEPHGAVQRPGTCARHAPNITRPGRSF